MSKERRQSRPLKPRQSRGAEMELRQPLAERLAAYALAAGAAGLAIMAGPQPADARIVYTPAHTYFGAVGEILDINNDGIADFSINQRFTSCCGWYAFLSVAGEPGNGVVGRHIEPYNFASRLGRNVRIGTSKAFYRTSNVRMGSFRSNTFSIRTNGPWLPGGGGFLGLEFQIDGQAHYGWARVLFVLTEGVHTPKYYQGLLTGYAYNTVPNQPLLAGQKIDADTIGELPPQPATLGLLALGAPGLDIWRPSERELRAE